MSDAPRAPSSRARLSAADPRGTMPLIRAVGQKLGPHEDLYHWVLTLTWGQFFGFLTLAFVVVNALFAGLYALAPGSVANATGLADCFFFSVETFATIGYGEMAPQNDYAHTVVVIEAFVGLLGTALVTGITFARFARPTARILFSSRCVIAPRNGVPHLMFRLANWRRNQIIEAQVHVIVLLTETTREGETMRRPTPLKLVRDKNPMFALTWTVMHEIDESSPFHGPDALQSLRDQRAEVFVSMSGLDETIMQTIHARCRYLLDDVVPQARFADILTTLDDGTRVVDYDKFHDIVPIPGGAS